MSREGFQSGCCQGKADFMSIINLVTVVLTLLAALVALLADWPRAFSNMRNFFEKLDVMFRRVLKRLLNRRRHKEKSMVIKEPPLEP